MDAVVNNGTREKNHCLCVLSSVSDSNAVVDAPTRADVVRCSILDQAYASYQVASLGSPHVVK